MSEDSQPAIGAETVLACSDEVLEAEIDGEKVMMSIDKGEYYGLDATGTEIWALFETPRSVAEICAAMVARYQVSPEDCERDERLELAYLCAVTGDRERAESLLDAWDYPWQPRERYERARVHAVLGDPRLGPLTVR